MILLVKRKQKQAEIALLISDKSEFKSETVNGDKNFL